MSQDPHQHPYGQDPNQGGNSGYGQPYPSAPGSGLPYPPPGQGYGGPQQPPKNGLGIAALVLGILSIVTALFGGFPGVIFGILAIIFGAVGMGRAKKGRATNRGMAMAGLITGIVGLVIGAVILFLAIKVAVDCNNELGSTASQSELDACIQDGFS